MTYAPIARILLRYIIGAVAAYGWISADTANALAVDPDLVLIVAGVLSAVVEGAYGYAKRTGGTT